MAVFITGAGIIQQELPEGYTKLNFIQCRGSEYIDTGIKGKNGIVVKTKVIPTAIGSDVCVIGSIFKNSVRYNVGISAAGKWEMQYGTEYGASSVDAVANTEYELEIQWVYNDGLLKINGTTAQMRTGTTEAASHNMFLGARSNGGTADRKAYLKIKSTQIYDNGTIVKNFVPCINPSNDIGMYEKVSGTFTGGVGKWIGG